MRAQIFGLVVGLAVAIPVGVRADSPPSWEGDYAGRTLAGVPVAVRIVDGPNGGSAMWVKIGSAAPIPLAAQLLPSGEFYGFGVAANGNYTVVHGVYADGKLQFLLRTFTPQGAPVNSQGIIAILIGL